MQQDKPTIKLTVPTGWDKLDDHQLRYVFGLLAQGFPSPQVKTYCLFRWTGMQVMHRYGKGWWCKFADDELRKRRQRCRWFSRKYYASVMRLKEFYEENIGKDFAGIMSDFARRANSRTQSGSV